MPPVAGSSEPIPTVFVPDPHVKPNQTRVWTNVAYVGQPASVPRGKRAVSFNVSVSMAAMASADLKGHVEGGVTGVQGHPGGSRLVSEELDRVPPGSPQP